MLDLAVRGGTVVTAQGSRAADVGVSEGRIAAIGSVGEAAREIDARGLLVLPGCVDPHTHLEPRHLDDVRAGTRAAAAGGVTTVLTFAQQMPGEGLLEAADRARGSAYGPLVDVAFHVVVVDPSDRAIADLPALAARGLGIKIFMVSREFAARTLDFLKLLRAAGQAGVLAAVHAEDRALIELRTQELHAAGRTSAEWFPESRPPQAEEIAVRAAVGYAEATGAAIYLVHLSSRGALAALREAKARGLRVYGETRPLYLYLTREMFRRPDAGRFVGQPPLRERADIDAVWEALADGTLDCVGTDHYPHRRADKLDPARSFDRVPPGVANLQTLLPMLHSEGVLRGRITRERMVDVLATTPARLMGLAPAKGEIAVGADADLVLFDPARKRAVRSADLVSNADDDPFDGWEVTGWPANVLARGDMVLADGRVLGEPGRGRLLTRTPMPLA